MEARAQSKWERLARRMRKHRAKAMVALVMIFLLVTVGGLVLKVGRDERLRREAEYGPMVQGALQKLHLAQLAGREAVRHEIGLQPWGERFLDPELSLVKARLAVKLLRKKLGFRSLMNVVPLDTSLVKAKQRTPWNAYVP